MVSVERLREVLDYDPSTGLLIWKKRPGPRGDKEGKAAGCLRKDGYLGVSVDRNPLLNHRVAWTIHYGDWPTSYIDHINRVRDDNRITNLREVSFSENTQNTKKYKNNKTGVKGVSLHTSGKYQATISVGGKLYYLGLFETISEAKRIRQSTQRKLHTCIGEL